MKRKIAAGFVLACTMALVGCSSSGGGAYLYPEYPEYTASDYVTLEIIRTCRLRLSRKRK